jgi:hypothetical protein
MIKGGVDPFNLKKRFKKIPSNLKGQFATLGVNVLPFINILMSML